MKTIALAWRHLWSRPLPTLLNLALMALGIASITFVLLLDEQVERAFRRDLAGIDLVVGAKGSPLQLILAGVFHIDVPPGNIPLDAVRELAANPQVAKLIPLNLGDSYRGFRIVGTTAAYPEHYGATLASGKWWAPASLEAVVGSQAASAASLAVGTAFTGSHGLAPGGHAHGDKPYRVTGVLAPCGCVLDRLILTSMESVWQVHEKATATDEEDRKALEAEREVTLALIAYRSPLAAITFPRFVNSSTEMQAAAPAVEVTRLLRMVSVGSDVLRGFGAVLLLAAALSVFIALWNAVRERRPDLAMLRMLGAPPRRLFGLLLAEALLLAALACVLGMAAGHLLVAAVAWLLQSERSLAVSGWVFLPAEGWIPPAAALVAVLAALLPALGAYRVDAAQLLNAR